MAAETFISGITRRTGRTPWLSPDDAAEACGVSTDTIRRRIADGTLPAYRVGRLIKIRETDLDRLLSRIPTAGVR